MVSNLKKTRKKIKFYDNSLKVLGVSVILLLVGIFVMDFLQKDYDLFWIITIFPMFISLGIISWGMIYHMFKGKYWGWLTLTIISIFIIGGFFIAIIFYFAKMREKFKKGEGVYEDGLYTNIFSKEKHKSD